MHIIQWVSHIHPHWNYPHLKKYPNYPMNIPYSNNIPYIVPLYHYISMSSHLYYPNVPWIIARYIYISWVMPWIIPKYPNFPKNIISFYLYYPNFPWVSHSSISPPQAASACQSGLVLVDGHVAPGRRMLQGGEVVLLRAGTMEEGDVPSKRRGGG